MKDKSIRIVIFDWLEENFVKTHQDIAPLLTVPTEYFREAAGHFPGELSTSIEPDLAAQLDPESLRLDHALRPRRLFPLFPVDPAPDAAQRAGHQAASSTGAAAV